MISALFDLGSGATALMQHAGKPSVFTPSRLWTLAAVTQLVAWSVKTYSDVVSCEQSGARDMLRQPPTHCHCDRSRGCPFAMQPKFSDIVRALGIPVDVPGPRDRHHAGWHWFRAAATIAGNLLMVACPVILCIMAFSSTWPRAGNVLCLVAQSLMAGGSLATLAAVTTPEKPLQRLAAMMPAFS